MLVSQEDWKPPFSNETEGTGGQNILVLV